MKKIVSVIIVAYNCEEFIDSCIKSVLKFLPENGEIVIIDNKSTDKTLGKLRKYYLNPEIKILESEENLGFGKANNKACKIAEGEYLFLQNPDTELFEPVLNKIINFYSSKPDIGIVAPKLVMPNKKTQPSVIKFPSLSGAISDLFFKKAGDYFPYVPEKEEPSEVDCVFGAAMLIKTDLFRKVGGFDEKYFMYYEDIDLCKRVNEAGMKVYYYPKVSIKHLVGGTKSKDKYSLNYKSSIIYNGLFKGFIFQLIFRLHRYLRLS